MKIDLACGGNKRPGFLGVDIASIPGIVDIEHDLNEYPWPFDDESVSEINCTHFIEHVDCIMKFMDECYRILKPGATMNIVAPYYTSIGTVQDPTHRRAISEANFLYFNKNWRVGSGLGHYPIKADFDFSFVLHLNSPWYEKKEEERRFAVTHYFNVVNSIQATLTKK